MNCTNCGAPVELVSGQGHFYCPFCCTLRFPESDGREHAEDGIAPLGQDTEWACPVCSAVLEEAVLEDSRVYYCRECRGILAAGDTFAAIVRLRRARFREPDRAPVPVNPDDLSRVLRCPMCCRPMTAHPYYGPGNVVIDSCSRCHVVWLDHGEISLIESAPGRR